jgi:hypothetical protein
MGFRRLRMAGRWHTGRWHIDTPSIFVASLKTSVSGVRACILLGRYITEQRRKAQCRPPLTQCLTVNARPLCKRATALNASLYIGHKGPAAGIDKLTSKRREQATPA